MFNLTQPVTGDVIIYLRRGYLRMAEQGLDKPDIMPEFEQVSSKRVAQDMRGDSFFYPRRFPCTA